jgi:DNA invertase Pin-like site-specific DNA recombinase
VAAEPVLCVVYAAKSTADRKGSIPEQLRECRAAIGDDPPRTIAGEYSDEAFGAFRGNRGPGLREAMRHAEELAVAQGESELWAQHSDRLARGDGRSARHAVEVALWALKHDVRVRTVQDPDTFRDLLYAVVMGQRNHEDSRRKGRSSKAGRRRAAERGEFIGYMPDGYRIAGDVDHYGAVKKRMELDPERQPAIEMIFRLERAGRRSGAIARALNDAGWLTRPRRKRAAPRTWTVNRVIEILKNPRYAGLAIFEGEIVARGCWPTYISERQHTLIQARLARRRPSKYPRELESYLLARVGRCGHCGSSLLALTSNPHRDGTLIRRYVCSSHHHGRFTGRCRAVPLDAGLVEAMFVSSLPTLLRDDSEHAKPVLPAETPSLGVERERLRDAILAGDDVRVDAALEALFIRMQPEAALIRDAAISHRRTRELKEVHSFQVWVTQETAGRTKSSRAKTRELNALLRAWFSTIMVVMDETKVQILAERKPLAGKPPSPEGTVSIDRAAWVRFSPLEREPHRRYRTWEDAEIIGALQAWRDTHGRSPRPVDWNFSYTGNGISSIPPALASAMGRGQTWDDSQLISALADYTADGSAPPAWASWLQTPPQHPCDGTVRAHFGSWQSALSAARL